MRASAIQIENALKCFADAAITNLTQIQNVHRTGVFNNDCLSACVHKAYNFYDSKGNLNVFIKHIFHYFIKFYVYLF